MKTSIKKYIPLEYKDLAVIKSLIDVAYLHIWEIQDEFCLESTRFVTLRRIGIANDSVIDDSDCTGHKDEIQIFTCTVALNDLMAENWFYWNIQKGKFTRCRKEDKSKRIVKVLPKAQGKVNREALSDFNNGNFY